MKLKIRNPYWDNVKAVLIFLVVLGHFLIVLRDNTQSRLVHTLYLYIYTFHMPAFVIVSGYFSKKYTGTSTKDYNKLVGLVMGFLAFKALLWISESIAFRTVRSFSFFAESGAPWYLICLFWWYLLLPFFSKIGIKKAMLLSIVVMLLIGTEPTANSFLSLVKMFNFLPFFMIGHCYASHEKSQKTTIIGLIIMIMLFIAAYEMLDIIKPYEGFIYGDKTYTYLGLDLLEGIAIKMIWFAVASIMSFVFFSVIPANRLLFTNIGERTLGIYVFHRVFRPFIMPIVGALSNNGVTIIVSTIIVSAIVTVVLSHIVFTKAVSIVINHNYILRNHSQK